MCGACRFLDRLLKRGSMKYVFSVGLVLISLAVAGFFVYLATNRTLTDLEGTLLQLFALLAGLTGSFMFGRQTGVNPFHARSALRRVTSLYAGLSRAAVIIDESRDFDSVGRYQVAFARLEELVRGQLITVDDALKDWRDVVPEDINDGLEEPFSTNPNKE